MHVRESLPRRIVSVVFFLLLTTASAFAEKRARTSNISGTWKVETEGRTGDTSTLVLVQHGNSVVGEWGTDAFIGERNGDTISLRAADSSSAEVKLTITASDTMKGTLAQAFIGHGRVFEVSDLKLRRTGDVPKTFALNQSATSQDIPAQTPNDVEGLPTVICNKVAGILAGFLTENLFAPMAPCEPSHEGGGYYLFGDEGPGPRPMFTMTVYWPWEDVKNNWKCPARHYSFTFRSDGTYDAEQMAQYYKGLQSGPLYEFIKENFGDDPSAHAEKIRAIADANGNFALFVGYNTKTFTVAPYLICESTAACTAIRNGSVVKTYIEKLTQFFTGPIGTMQPLFVGDPIGDHYWLERNDLPYCVNPVIFLYVVGTLNVKFN